MSTEGVSKLKPLQLVTFATLQLPMSWLKALALECLVLNDLYRLFRTRHMKLF
jgi:hypothetical protein